MSSAFQHRLVLTGGPGSGKSTIIDTIIKRKFWCSKEVGRGVIQDQVNIGGDALPWASQTVFAGLMLSWEIRSWHEAEKYAQPRFFDRGVPDAVGYLRFSELTIPRYLGDTIGKFRYNQVVFIASPWHEIYVQDTEREQSFDVAIATYHAMVEAYRMYDYQLIELPYVSVEGRVNSILSRIKPC